MGAIKKEIEILKGLANNSASPKHFLAIQIVIGALDWCVDPKNFERPSNVMRKLGNDIKKAEQKR
jgi:hypothetical protein